MTSIEPLPDLELDEAIAAGTDLLDDHERLREVLLTVECLRQTETTARKEAQALLSGLEVLTKANSIQSMFKGILEVIGEVIPFSQAAVLVADSDDRLTVRATTTERLVNLQLRPENLIRRVLGGKPVMVMDLLQIPEWEQLPSATRHNYRSALLLPLQTPSTKAIFVCLHDEPGSYSRRHLDLLQYFTPLAAQAIARSEEMAEIEGLISRLEHMAHHDALTDLANRTLFHELLGAAIERVRHSRREAIGILNVDLDDFKMINDTLGHDAGDALLVEVAARMRRSVRTGDTVARLGGDEFAVLLSGVHHQGEVDEIATKIIDAISKPFVYNGHTIRPAASLGSTFCEDPGRSSEVLLKHADVALYDAKSCGGGCHRSFTHGLRSEFVHDEIVEAELYRAIQNDELVVHYQPILRAEDQEVVAVEALVRWEHPVRGLIPPNDFIPIAERSSLILDLGRWVLRRALTECAPWLRSSPERRVAVNIASRQILSPSFAGEVRAALQDNDLDASCLELELSEEIVVKRTVEVMLRNLQRLHRDGIDLSFDDFGTGYSSIQQLRRFPGQRLKIDRSFVMRMVSDQADAAIVKSMVELAHGLNLTVIAEGVETRAQEHMLNGFGCDELQGFLYSRPQPADQMLAVPDTPSVTPTLRAA